MIDERMRQSPQLNTVTIDSMSPVEVWIGCIAVIISAGGWSEDDGVPLKELLGLRYRLQAGPDVVAAARILANSALSPYRQGKIDSERGGTDYWALIGAPDADGPFGQIIDQLRARPGTKQASLSLPRGPHGLPCLVNIDFKVRQEKLWFGAIFRSQDVFRRQPENIAFLCEVSHAAAEKLRVTPVAIDVTVASAHIYQPDIVAATARLHDHALSRRSPSSMPRPIAIAVMGKERLYYDNPEHTNALASAFRAGMHLAAHGAVVVSGGLGGIMEAASSGARAVGGMAVGIVPEIVDDEGGRRKPNESQIFSVATSLDQRARMPVIIDSVDAVLIVHGGGGTRVEAELALAKGVPVVTLAGSGGVADELAKERRKGLFIEIEPIDAAARCLELGRQHRQTES